MISVVLDPQKMEVLLGLQVDCETSEELLTSMATLSELEAALSKPIKI